MDTIKMCGKCGAPLPKDAPHGLCPQCLFAAASFTQSTANSARPAIAPTGVRLRYFGDYELQEKIAQGGMGVVYKARQLTLNRTVAIKMILAGQLAEPADIERFLTEAEAAANLRHPNIVAIHEVAEHEGQRYFSMDYIDGPNLAVYIKTHGVSVQEAARLARTIADAVHHAHQRGTLHRDLKPQNVLIDSAGELHVTDFWLAKLTERDSGLTESGAVMGSPSYMPPEQAAGRRAEVGPPSDVYSIGAILYQLLTGQPPFQRETPIETMEAVVNEPPQAPSKLNPAAPRDLETICLKCLEKRPERRYFSARELAEELDRFLNHEPILARPASVWRVAWNWTQRNPWIFAAGFGCLALAMVCVAYGLWEKTQFLNWRMTSARPEASTNSEAGSFYSFDTGLRSSGASPPGARSVGQRTPAIPVLFEFPLVALAVYFSDRSFKKRCRNRGAVGAAMPERVLAAHAGVGLAAAILALAYLLQQIRWWVWSRFSPFNLVIECLAVACVLPMVWIGCRMMWEAAGIHESSRFRDVVEKSLERERAMEAAAWSAKRKLAAVAWVGALTFELMMLLGSLLFKEFGEPTTTSLVIGASTSAGIILILVAAARRKFRRWFNMCLPGVVMCLAVAGLLATKPATDVAIYISPFAAALLAWTGTILFEMKRPVPAGVAQSGRGLWMDFAAGVVAMAALVAFFYLEEDLRGGFAWEHMRAQLTASGVKTDWSVCQPVSAPDSENIFAAPKMQEWLTGRGVRELSERIQQALGDQVSNMVATNPDPKAAARFLQSTAKLEPELDLMRRALQRPRAVMQGDYSHPTGIPIPNFVAMRDMAQLLAATSHCHLLLGHEDAALADLTLMHDMRRFVEGPPNGYPETLVASMINVAVADLYARAMAEGLDSHKWGDESLIALQGQLSEKHLIPFVRRSMECEILSVVKEIAPRSRDGISLLLTNLQPPLGMNGRIYYRIIPSGWYYQNVAACARIMERNVKVFDLPSGLMRPELVCTTLPAFSPYTEVAYVVIPNLTRCVEDTARSESEIRQAVIVCALERHRLRHGSYPRSVNDLQPEFLGQIPVDPIGGKTPQYRLTINGGFELSSASHGEKGPWKWPPIRR